MPAARQNRSKLADTSSQALPTAPISVAGNTVGVVLILFMALLSFRGISTLSLRAQGEQRRSSYFNISRGNPGAAPAPLRACARHHSSCATLRLRFNLPQPGVSIIRAAAQVRRGLLIFFAYF